MQKAHDSAMNEYWRNKPDLSTPILAEKKNQLEVAVDTIDNRVIVLDTTKANQTDMLQAVKTIAYTEATGTFRITFFNNTYVDIDTDLEKLAVNFDYDDNPQSAHYQNLIITLDDGTVKYVDLSALITQYEFLSTSTIQAVVGADGSISFNVINGSITEEKLEPNFLANCRLEVSKALGFSQDAEAWAKGTKGGTPVGSTDERYHNNAKYYSEVAHTEADNATTKAQDSEAWAVGKRNGQDVPSTDETYHNNAKYWAEQAEGAVTGNDKVTWEANGVLGAKNLIPYPYYEKNYSNNGVVWTCEEEGTISVTGTATSRDYFNLTVGTNRTDGQAVAEKDKFNISALVGKTVILSFKVSEVGSNSTFGWGYCVRDSSSTNIASANIYNSNSVAITIPDNAVYMDIFAEVFSGATVSDITFTEPMLRLAEDTDDTFEPYAKTNQQLTKDKTDKTDIATVESGTTASRAYSVGELVYVSGTLYRVKTAIASGATFTVGTNVEVTDISNSIKRVSDTKINAGTDVQEISLPYITNINRRLIINGEVPVPVSLNGNGVDGGIVSMYFEYDAVQGMYLKIQSTNGYTYKVLLSV